MTNVDKVNAAHIRYLAEQKRVQNFRLFVAAVCFLVICTTTWWSQVNAHPTTPSWLQLTKTTDSYTISCTATNGKLVYQNTTRVEFGACPVTVNLRSTGENLDAAFAARSGATIFWFNMDDTLIDEYTIPYESFFPVSAN